MRFIKVIIFPKKIKFGLLVRKFFIHLGLCRLVLVSEKFEMLIGLIVSESAFELKIAVFKVLNILHSEFLDLLHAN